MDYDQSIQLPPEVSLRDCRRPSDEAYSGWDLYKPDDLCNGQAEYNPFAFDVGMLGNLFRVHLSVSIHSDVDVPFAPNVNDHSLGRSSDSPDLAGAVRQNDDSHRLASFQCSGSTRLLQGKYRATGSRCARCPGYASYGLPDHPRPGGLLVQTHAPDASALEPVSSTRTATVVVRSELVDASGGIIEFVRRVLRI